MGKLNGEEGRSGMKGEVWQGCGRARENASRRDSTRKVVTGRAVAPWSSLRGVTKHRTNGHGGWPACPTSVWQQPSCLTLICCNQGSRLNIAVPVLSRTAGSVIFDYRTAGAPENTTIWRLGWRQTCRSMLWTRRPEPKSTFSTRAWIRRHSSPRKSRHALADSRLRARVCARWQGH